MDEQSELRGSHDPKTWTCGSPAMAGRSEALIVSESLRSRRDGERGGRAVWLRAEPPVHLAYDGAAGQAGSSFPQGCGGVRSGDRRSARLGAADQRIRSHRDHRRLRHYRP